MTMSWSNSQQEDTLRYLNGRLEYAVRVRDTTYLWGSSKLAEPVTLESPIMLHVGNDRFGQEISLAMMVGLGVAPKELGALGPGEIVSLQIQGIMGIYATCAEESIVRCVISVLPIPPDTNIPGGKS